MSRKRVAIVQSNYIPWKGYFDLINSVDEFVLYDDVQYTKRDWRNRNMIKTATGLQWLSVPIDVKGRYLQKICEARISDATWQKKHWASIVGAYAKASGFQEGRDLLEPLYGSSKFVHLSEMNRVFLQALCRFLGIATKISVSMDYKIDGEDKTEKLVSLCKQAGATDYLSGPSAKCYMSESLFHSEGITVSYFDYSGYREYRQLHGAFEHGVSVIDLIMNEGLGANQFLKTFQSQRQIHEERTCAN